MHQSERDSILTVFLAEAEEIVQRLFVQLEELHFGYDSQRILDDIHRGFHTLYGAAALMELEPLTECTQLADKLMERLRTRRLSLSPSLVSLMVGLTSAVEAMLARLAERQPLYPIPEDLRGRLQRAAGIESSATGGGLSDSPQLDSQRLDQFFATGNWEAGSAKPAEDALSSLAAGGEGAIARLLADRKSGGTPPVDASRFVELADVELALAPAQVQNRLQQLEESTLIAHPEQASASSAIAGLIEELSWVRRRLHSVLADSDTIADCVDDYKTLEKSLLHLQLITEDMQSWLQADSEPS